MNEANEKNQNVRTLRKIYCPVNRLLIHTYQIAGRAMHRGFHCYTWIHKIIREKTYDGVDLDRQVKNYNK